MNQVNELLILVEECYNNTDDLIRDIRHILDQYDIEITNIDLFEDEIVVFTPTFVIHIPLKLYYQISDDIMVVKK